MEFEEEALRVIAKRAIERKTGARGLKAILEDIMLNVMFDIPSRNDIEKCIITKDTILNNGDPILIISKASVPEGYQEAERKAGIGILG